MSDSKSTSYVSPEYGDVNVGRYVDLMIDVAFKRVFGFPANKDLLMALLSAVLPELEIRDLTYLDKEKTGVSEGDKKSVFDLLCQTADGEEVLIEIQLSPQDWFRDRTLYYVSQELLWQHKAGDEVYTLKPIYVISFLNFVMQHEADDKEKFVWRYSLLEKETVESMTKALNFTYVELPKFNKKESELANLQDKFYFCLSQMGKLSERPGNLDGEVFRKLFEVAEFAKMDHRQQRQYIAKMTTDRDIKNQIAYARKEGLEQGLKRGLDKGLAQGKAEGAVAIARALKAKGIALDVIADCTRLSVSEIADL